MDTSSILALINERDQYHEQAEKLSYRFENSLLITTDAVLLEIGNALTKEFRAEAGLVIKVLRNSQRVEVIEIGNRLFEMGLDAYEKYRDKTWGLVDCISFVVMQEKAVTEALTFDSDFKQAGFTVVAG